jgi:hypothetical protein
MDNNIMGALAGAQAGQQQQKGIGDLLYQAALKFMMQGGGQAPRPQPSLPASKFNGQMPQGPQGLRQQADEEMLRQQQGNYSGR